MAAFKAFDPDPDLTDPEDPYFGTGTWTYDDGTSTYGQGDRDEAMSLWQRPDTRIADASTADTAPMGPPPAPVPGQEALNANEPQADVGPPPMIARPPEPEPQQPSGIAIPRESRIAYVHNNPGNLKFVGQEGASQGEPAADGGHWAAFETPEQGVAALNRQVEIDAGRGQTVREFVTKYAPPGSNDTEQYIQQASQALGADPDAKLSDLERGKVVAFMARKESGTELGGTSLPEQPPARAPMPGVPGIPGGLRPAVAEMRGMPLSPEQVQERQRGVYDSTMTAVGAVQNAAEQRQQGRQEALALVADQHERFKADQQAQIQRAVATRQEAEKNIQQAMAAQLDPGRAIKNMSTGQMVLGAVAMALGTLGNAMAIRRGMKTVNPAAWLEKAIEDDIQDQKQSKQSRIAHWTRIFGDAEMGERAARSELNTAVGNYMQYQAQQKVTDADIQAQAMQDAAALIGKGQQEAQALVDKENERLSIRYQPPDPKAVGALAGTIARVGVEDRDPETREALANAYNPGNTADRGQMTALTNEMQEVTKLEQTLNGLKQWYGVGTDKENYDSSATGPWWNPGNWADNDQKDRELRDAWSKVEVDTRTGWKAEPNGEAVQVRLSGVNMPKRDEEAPTKLLELEEEIKRRKEAIMSGTNAPVRAAWKYQNGYPLETSKGGRPVTGKIQR